MMKAILGRDIQKGDAVLVAHNELKMIGDEVPASIDSRRVYGLLHRPWPEGMTEQDMLQAIDDASKDLWLGRGEPVSGRVALREAIETYELGRPLKENEDWVHPKSFSPPSPSGCGPL